MQADLPLPTVIGDIQGVGGAPEHAVQFRGEDVIAGPERTEHHGTFRALAESLAGRDPRLNDEGRLWQVVLGAVGGEAAPLVSEGVPFGGLGLGTDAAVGVDGGCVRRSSRCGRRQRCQSYFGWRLEQDSVRMASVSALKR
jgi:hypothetical protein